MKQKIIAVSMALGLTLCLSGCGKNAESQSTITAPNDNTPIEITYDADSELRNIATEMATSLSELVACDSYLNVMTSSDEIMEVVETWRNVNIDKTSPIYMYPIDSKTIESCIKYSSNDKLDLTDMSDNIKDYVISNCTNSLVNIINSGAGGVDVLAASSIVRYSKTFVPRSSIENQVWMIPCEDTVAVCISFTNTGSGALTVTASYAVYDKEIKEMLSESLGFSVEEIEW